MATLKNLELTIKISQMNKVVSKMRRFFTFLITVSCVVILLGAGGILFIAMTYGRALPDYTQLEDYNPPTVTRLYATDGEMLAEYAKEKRLFVPIHAIPKRLIYAFISAEDQNFYSHSGIDLVSIFRAAVSNVANIGRNKALVGGSTITQQVVKNFLLTNERSLERKIREAILSFRITKAYSKDRIMELYLNEIYLGNRSYGVAAAALNYFNKSIDELTIEEAAMLAALPKAPSNLDPHKYYEKAKSRRDWVIQRMEEEGYIDEAESLIAMSKPINLKDRDKVEIVNAGFFTDTVKQQLEQQFGEDGVQEQGYTVRTTLDTNMQKYAEQALIKGLVAYDKRHGWRGGVTNLKSSSDMAASLKEIENPIETVGWRLAVVTGFSQNDTFIMLKDGNTGKIEFDDLKWARKYLSENSMGPVVSSPRDVLKVGDVIYADKKKENKYKLMQIPEVNGGIVAMDPYTGRVKAMVGGLYYGGSQFNRAVQAKRQPGSAFKPFVYLAALENNFSPNTIIVDEEIQLDQGDDQPEWRPQNYSGDYYGPTTLRIGVERSRNAMTVRLADMMGISEVVEITKRFNISDNPQRNFSLALGSDETTLLRLTNAYSMLVNGGKRIEPYMIERVHGRSGKIIFRNDNRECENCNFDLDDDLTSKYYFPPEVVDIREQIADPIPVYQTVSILEGVIERGTGKAARSIGKVLAGKTGTTNDSFDAWFVGFSADLAIGVYVGFDNPKTLGKRETGASAALPIWIDFTKNALKGIPDKPFRRPKGIKLVKIDAKTGMLPSPNTPPENIIFEAFRDGQEPTSVGEDSPFAGESEGEDSDFGANGVY